MRIFLREIFLFLGAICSIYTVIYLFISENWKCQLWAALAVFIVTYIAHKICTVIVRRKNAEINQMAERKKRLEIQVLGEQRETSGYDPDEHN